jgi:hypothetical protein
MTTPDETPRPEDALADKAEAAVARMTEVVRDGKEQIKRLHRIMAKIDNLQSVKR